MLPSPDLKGSCDEDAGLGALIVGSSRKESWVMVLEGTKGEADAERCFFPLESVSAEVLSEATRIDVRAEGDGADVLGEK